MGMIRGKLNEHVVYLQNELRKRDELLDSDSDFDDATFDNDSCAGLDLKAQESDYKAQSMYTRQGSESVMHTGQK